ncbi:MAG: L,D-transpeptidase [Bacteroidota bacterium]
MRTLFFLPFFFLSMMLASPTPFDSIQVAALKAYVEQTYEGYDFEVFLYVSLKDQKMYLIKDWEVETTYLISGAKKGAGNRSGSNQTPTGLHKIAEKHGEGVPLGGILKARHFTEKVAEIFTDETDLETDDVTTRVLWLQGVEEGFNKGGNVDSYQRYIYIHGTPEEGLLGKPASHGCIRMKNQQVIELFEQVGTGTLVLILNK